MHEHWIARHHFPLGLMQCDGNKAIAVAKDDDANVELPQLPGKDQKVKKISTLLSRVEVKKHGIHAQSKHRMIGNKKGCLQVPIASKEDATANIYELRSDRRERQRLLEENEPSNETKSRKKHQMMTMKIVIIVLQGEKFPGTLVNSS